uniref:Uncharacterized protein n=1 Tax=Romanomermis culicivorax TaxID=13658 RepID=A0A915K5W6_ROMCU
ITSYNGYLRLRVNNQGGNYLNAPVKLDDRHFGIFPLIVLVGNYRIVLEHYVSVSESSEDGLYIVKFREDLWKNQLNPKKQVDRQTLMIALQNVQAIFIRATFVDHVTEASLSDVSMDIGIAQNSSLALSNPAIGVEHCDCPAPHSGPSCQHPADGYCRKKKQKYLDSENNLDLVGTSVPCSCHSHSNVCDKETCRCMECQHNTTGDFCENCAPGFYGNARKGSEFDCQKCACPSLEHSYSKSCYATTHNDYGYVCDQCRRGHAGIRCEKCVVGYFGDPLRDGKPCQPCACNKFGSVSDDCDSMTGQCHCGAGVTGRDCSECRPRYALIACDLGCTRELMIKADRVESFLLSHNFTGLVPAPWGRLSQIKNLSKVLDANFARLFMNDNETSSNEFSIKIGVTKKRRNDTQTTKFLAQYRYNFALDVNKSVSDLHNKSEHFKKEAENMWLKIT